MFERGAHHGRFGLATEHRAARNEHRQSGEARNLGTITHSLERQVAERVAAAVLRGMPTDAAPEDDDCLRVPGARQIQGG